MSTQEEIGQAIVDFNSGKFGQIQQHSASARTGRLSN